MSIKAFPRRALVIGIAGYVTHPLLNAKADACRVADVLRQRGFETDLLTDSSGSVIDSAIALFTDNAADAEIAIIYLAGHAVERHGAGYFLG